MITVEFKDYNELKRFAREVLGSQEEAGNAAPAPQTNTPASKPAATMTVAPVSAGSISPTPNVPVTIPTAPVTVQAAAPITTATKAPPTLMNTSVLPSATVPTSAASYSPDDLAKAAIPLMEAGGQGQLIALLAEFGVHSLPDLRPEQYGAFATALRGLGAKI